MKVAIVHDWLVGGGAEQVVKKLHEMYPEAPIYTSYCTDEWREKLDNKVITGFLQRWPFSRLRKYLALLRIWWFTHLDLSGYDLVISSSGNGEAKGVKAPKNTKHICYCHTPTHFYWRHHDYYMENTGFGKLASLGLRIFSSRLRKWDKLAAQRPDKMIANSTHISRDIQKFYDRKSVVIHPPVDVKRFSQNITKAPHKKGFLAVGRQVPYKRVDIIVDACTKLNLPLTVVGDGPEHNNLVKRAGKTVKFVTDASDDEVVRYMSSSEAFILAAFEDFGITPVEAMAAGTPVIAYEAGGALDYVIPAKTGLFFDRQTADSLSSTLVSFDSESFDSEEIAKHAGKFDGSNFEKRFKSQVRELVNE